MCGRYSFGKTDRIDWGRFGVPAVPTLVPQWNVAPGNTVVAVRAAREGARQTALLRWGLIPHWAKDPSIGNRLVNARAESAAEKPAFRDAFRTRRCVLPADGFYEWQMVVGQKSKQPWRVEPPDGGFFALGALWEQWRAPDNSHHETCTVLTVPANATLRHIHDRMPVLIAVDDFAEWLSPESPTELAHALCRSAPEDCVLAWRVSTAVNSALNNDPTIAVRID